MGYENCHHLHNTSNRSLTMKHFEESHYAVTQLFGARTAVLHIGSTYQIKNGAFSIWTPVLLPIKKSLFVIMGNVDEQRKSVSWSCLQVCGADDEKDSDQYTIELSFVAMESNQFRPIVSLSTGCLKICMNCEYKS